MTSDSEKSFKARLRAIAKEKNRDPADLWQSITLERFLVRLAKSEYSKCFVLKGGRVSPRRKALIFSLLLGILLNQSFSYSLPANPHLICNFLVGHAQSFIAA